MLKVFAYLSKRDDIDNQTFVDHYENKHVPLVLSLTSAPPIYKRNYVLRGDEFTREDGTLDFDVITELVFDDRIGFLRWIGDLGVPEIAEDEERFLNRARTRVHVIDERVEQSG
jgi:hypothetical protein